MNPEQQPPQQPAQPTPPSSFAPTDPNPVVADTLGTSYLNQIAPTQIKTVNRFAVFGLIGGFLVIVIAIVAVMLSSGGPDISARANSLNRRITTIQTIADSQQKRIQSSSISEANTALSSVLKTMNTDLSSLIKTLKLGSKNSKTSSSTETKYLEALQAELENAHLRGTLDRTYAPLMTLELTKLRNQLLNLKNASQSKAIDEFCASSITNIEAVLKSFESSSSN